MFRRRSFWIILALTAIVWLMAVMSEHNDYPVNVRVKWAGIDTARYVVTYADTLLPLTIKSNCFLAIARYNTVKHKAFRITTTTDTIVKVGDALFEELECAAASMLVVPGGTTRYAEHEGLKQQLLAFAQKGGRVAAICASPAVLGQIGLLQGRAATCYPGFEAGCTGATLQTERAVVVDGNITTGRGPGLALEFALELVRQMAGEEKRQEVAKGLLLA